MVQAALPRQDSVTSLTQVLTSIAGKVVLPEPVVRAAQQVLAGRVAVDDGAFDAAVLQKAIQRSGVFQEASLAKPGTPLLAPQADMKSSLLALRQVLTAWLGQQAPLTQAAQIPPPLRGHVPRAKLSDAPPIDPRAAPEEVGKQLLERTEAALSRVRLHQSASLPDPVAKTADWSMDVPVLVGQHQTLLQIQIHRDEHNGTETAAERGWQMRFAINLPGMGEVGAQVSLRGGNTGVMLWAAERAASEALEADAASLRDALAAVGLKAGAVIVRHGEPPAPAPAPSGHFVDART
jgi:flagellar hook-length control protein FliK